jgi:hypothetical protein
MTLYGSLTGVENLAFFCALAGLEPGHAALREHLRAAGLPASALERRAATICEGHATKGRDRAHAGQRLRRPPAR